MFGKRTSLRVGVSLLVVAAALAAGWFAAALEPDARPRLSTALDAVPASTTVLGFTDWASIRDRLGDDDLLSEARRRDLSTRSVIGREDPDAQREVLGWTASQAEWEVLGENAKEAAVLVVRLTGSVDFGDLETKLRSAGYQRKGDVWASGGKTGVPSLLSQVSLVPRQRLVVASDRGDTVERALDVVHGRARSLARVHSAVDTAQALAGSHSVLLQTGRLGCGTAAVTGEDGRERQARAAEQRAGRLVPYRYSGRGLEERGGSGFGSQRLVFAMTFDTAAEAAEQARVRERLATGPFIGRSGAIGDTLRIDQAGSDAATVHLAFDHDPDTGVFMTGTGPVLFASC